MCEGVCVCLSVQLQVLMTVLCPPIYLCLPHSADQENLVSDMEDYLYVQSQPESWRKPAVPDFVRAQPRTLTCIFCFSVKLALSGRGFKCFEERAQKGQWWATGSTLLLRAVRILAFIGA